MPVKIKKKDGKYEVSTPGGIKGKNMTLKNAVAQERILNAVEHTDWRPTGLKRKKKA